MGTLLKYLFYILIIAAIYFIGVGFYQGTLTKNSTVSEMTDHVTSSTGQVIKDGYNATKDAIQNGVDTVADDVKNTQTTMENELKDNSDN